MLQVSGKQATIQFGGEDGFGLVVHECIGGAELTIPMARVHSCPTRFGLYLIGNLKAHGFEVSGFGQNLKIGGDDFDRLQAHLEKLAAGITTHEQLKSLTAGGVLQVRAAPREDFSTMATGWLTLRTATAQRA